MAARPTSTGREERPLSAGGAGGEREEGAAEQHICARRAELERLERVQCACAGWVQLYGRRLREWRARLRELRVEGARLPRRDRALFEEAYAALRARLDDARLALARLEGARDERTSHAAMQAAEEAFEAVRAAEVSAARTVRKGLRRCRPEPRGEPKRLTGERYGGR